MQIELGDHDVDPPLSRGIPLSGATFDDLPAEVVSYIVRLVYLEAIPRSVHRNLDLHGLPSTYSDGRRISSPHSTVQRNLWALCLTSRKLFAHARPLLYRRINITLPYSFILLIRTLGAAALAKAYENFQVTGKLNQDPEDPNSFTSLIAAAGFARVLGTSLLITAPAGSGAGQLQRRRAPNAGLNGEHEDELDLVWRQDPFGDQEAPTTRWTVSLHPLGADADALQRCLRVVEFSSFRTQGLGRTIGEGTHMRFVTSSRLLALLTAAPDLVSFGASSTMDSALSVEVLEALLFRGGRTRRPARLRGVSVERRKKGEQLSLSAIDFTGCISPVFEAGMEDFVNRHLRKFSGRHTDTLHEEDYSSAAERSTESETDGELQPPEEDVRGRSGRTGPPGALRTQTMSASQQRGLDEGPARHPARETRFGNIQRLSLNGIVWPVGLLSPFLLAFPRLTHLDLSRTKIDAALLRALSASPTLHLESLSLAGCRGLTSEAITEFLVDSPVTSQLVELSLEGSLLFPMHIEPHDLKAIITMAPALRSGQLRYLDMGGCGMDDELLSLLKPQPFLLDLGLGASSRLTLGKIAAFLKDKAPNVQVLELTDSCFDPEREAGLSALDLATQLINPCCSTPPLPLSLQLAALGFKPVTASEDTLLPPRNEMLREPTNLRVIGLNGPSLRDIRDGIGPWKVIWGAGKRGWVVDTSAGPNPEASDTELEAHQEDIERAAAAAATPMSMTPLPESGSLHRRALSPATSRSRSRIRQLSRTGYEPETPPLSPRTSRSPSRSRSMGRPSPMSGHIALAPARASISRSRSRGPAGSHPLAGPTPALVRTASNPGVQAHDSLSPPPLIRAHTAWSSDARSSPSPTRESADSDVIMNVDEAAASTVEKAPLRPRSEIIRNLPATHPRRAALEYLGRQANTSVVSAEVGWHSRKMEILLGFGMLGRERGNYAFVAYC